MLIIIRRLSFYIIVLTFIIFLVAVWALRIVPASLRVSTEPAGFEDEIQNMFKIRNLAILVNDGDGLKSLYALNTKLGEWAYEHGLKKTNYLHSWSKKQGVKFLNIDTSLYKLKAKHKGAGFSVNFTASTVYEYSYLNEPEKINMFRIGTYHSMDVVKREESWLIAREWYTDPFADSLNLDDKTSNGITNYILGRGFEGKNTSKRQNAAIEYADRYCGAAAESKFGLTYNKKYKNYNSLGGDCANFASQIMYEGGKFKKNYSWNYTKEGSKAWVNAAAFKDYMLYSGRASLIASGSYEKIYKAAFNMQPGDFVAYEKKGKVTHISVVTGWDSKGYPLVNSHNTDRYRVPWDLGWSDKGIKFWLVHMHF